MRTIQTNGMSIDLLSFMQSVGKRAAGDTLYEYLLHNARRLLDHLSGEMPLGVHPLVRVWRPVQRHWFSSGAYMNTYYTMYTMRGGSWNDYRELACCAFRGLLRPVVRDDHIGFRLVLT